MGQQRLSGLAVAAVALLAARLRRGEATPEAEARALMPGLSAEEREAVLLHLAGYKELP